MHLSSKPFESCVALFGGSFDPVHIGHLFIVEEARHALGIEQVMFVPAFQPPHKNELPRAGAKARLQMLELALEGRPYCSVLDWELQRGGVSYTIETVERFRNEFAQYGRPALIIGDDLCRYFGTWKDAHDLLSLVELIVAVRDGTPESDTIGEYYALDNSPLAVSSSDIRNRVREGRNFWDLVPAAVYGYIQEQELYR